MREILFKAKTKDYKEWVEGNLLELKGEYYISPMPYQCMKGHSSKDGEKYGFGGFEMVNESTICQYTGLTDKNKRKIWENDIVTIRVFYEIAEGYCDLVQETGVLCYDSCGMLSLNIASLNNTPCYSNILLNAELAGVDFHIDILGNIYDNPELLKERDCDERDTI